MGKRGPKLIPPEVALTRFTRRLPNGCLEWTRGRTGQGYGVLVVEGGKQVRMHRVSWELANGRSVPEGLVVRHHCDNKWCVEPSHLTIGTVKDNTHDAIERGLFPAGETQGLAKLTAVDVLDIRQRYAAGEATQEELARLYGTTQTNISMIVRRKTWRSVA